VLSCAQAVRGAMPEEAAAAAEAQQPQHEEQEGHRAARLRRLLWLLLVVAIVCLVVVSPMFLQDIDQKSAQKADDRGSDDCRMVRVLFYTRVVIFLIYFGTCIV